MMVSEGLCQEVVRFADCKPTESLTQGYSN